MIWLVAEDETDIRMLITTMFQVWGKQPVAYENGQKVWDWLDAFEGPGVPADALPELVLMDIRMPGKKGNEVARRMRSMPQFNAVPIILMTAFALTEDERREMMTADGVDQIIHKPLPDFEQLRALLHQAVERKARLAETESASHDPHPPAR
ncbi:MAG: response regulator [Candidatus Flexifilum sp.]